MKMAGLYLIISIAFFGNSLERYNLLPPIVNWLTEPLIYVLFFYALITNRDRIRLPLLPLMLFLMLIGSASAIINQTVNLEFLFGIRLIIRFYIFFLAVVNLQLSDMQIKRINNYLVFLFILQIPVATVKLFIYGQGEAAIGTYSVNEGSLSTMIPLIAIGYLIAFYCYCGQRIGYALLSLGFVYFSFVAGKRALVFIMPFFMAFMALLIFRDKSFDRILLRKIRRSMVIIVPVLTVIVIVAGLKYIPTLNPERVVGGSVDFGHAINYFKSYTTQHGKMDPRYTVGRISTTKQIFTVMFDKGYDRFLLGYGPGAYTESRFVSRKSNITVFKDIRIQYGLTPLGFMQIEYGFLGLITYLVLLLSLFIGCISYWKLESDLYWKAYAFGSVGFAFSMILLWGGYHTPSLIGDTIPCVYFYCMAIVVTKHYSKITDKKL